MRKSRGKRTAHVRGIDQQPVNGIRWVDRNDLRANGYNPNRVAPPELELLKISILEDGWTQPIVARMDGEIVDGYHRWMVSEDPEIAAMTGGRVPVVFLRDSVTGEHQMMSTIRHNRARGSHYVLDMSGIVRRLIDDEHLTTDEVMDRLQMEREEVQRLYDQGCMIERGSKPGFNQGWVPTSEK